MPATRTSRLEALDRIADVMRRHGYDGASLSLISEATGLGRASLYHHFPGGKEEMAREVFGRVGESVQARILDPLEREESPDACIAGMIRGLDAFYEGGGKNCLLGAMVLSGGSDRFSEELRASFRKWIDALARVLRRGGLPRAEARRRADGAVAQIQGSLVVSRGLGSVAPFREALKALPSQLLAEPEAKTHKEKHR